ncbi:MAG: 30S ribosomal protein S6 [Patescibacteria group bacterium]
MSGYELLYLIPLTKTQEEVQNIIRQVNQILLKHKANILYNDIWSRSKLSYSIKKAEHSFYVLCYFEANDAVPAKVKQDLLLISDILRNVIIKHKHLEPQIKRFVEKQEPIKRIYGKSVKPKPVVLNDLNAPAIKEEKTPELAEIKQADHEASIKELDKKLEDILGEEIEL